MNVGERTRAFDRWDLAAVAVVFLGIGLLHVPLDGRLTDDPHIYGLMAQDPLGHLPPAPFRFRVGTTLLAAWLPFSVETNFLLISGAAVSGTALVLRRTTERLADGQRGLVALLLFVASGPVLNIMRLPYATEPLSMLAGAGALELGRRRRWLAAGLVLAAGATARETTVFLLLPLGVWCLAAEAGRADRGRALLSLGAAPVAVYLLLHRTPLLYGFVPGERVQTPEEILRWNLHAPGGFGHYLVLVVLGSLGLLWCYLPGAVRSADRYLASSVLLLVPLLLGTMIASDWGRILGYAIIVAVPAASALAPGRIIQVLVPAQLAVAYLIYNGWTWPSLVVVAAFAVAVRARGGLSPTRHAAAMTSSGITGTLNR